MSRFIYSQSFSQKSAEMKSTKKYFFLFCFDVRPRARILAVRLINQHTTYSLKSVQNDRFFRRFSWQFVFTPKVFAENLLTVCHRRNNWCFNRGLTSNKPTHYLLDYSDQTQLKSNTKQASCICFRISM